MKSIRPPDSNCRALPRTLPERRWQALPPAARVAVLHAACIAVAPVFAQWLPLRWTLTEGLLAAAGGALLGLAPWWMVINACFVPALDLALNLALPPAAWLAAFLTMTLLYWSVATTQVPLFLSSDVAAGALARVVSAAGCRNLLDLGCGDARLIARLAASCPGTVCGGIEHAPLPWLAGKLRLWSGAACSLRRGDFWAESLTPYDCVYAYLSPVPMPALWNKAQREMRPGALFVSNSFPVPGVKPESVVNLDDGWGGCLHIYRIPGQTA